MFDEIDDKESYWGEVVSVDDPKKASRIRVRVVTVYDGLDIEAIPWSIPRYLDNSKHDLPAIGDIVQVKFLNNDVYLPTWYRIRSSTKLLSDDDYNSATVITEKDLSKYGLDGSLSARYTKSEGLILELTRNSNTSKIIIRNDNSIFLQNAKTGKVVHISNQSLSFGSENKSQQPSVVGDDNVKALTMLNDTIQELSVLMNSQLALIAQVASTSPYTKPLTKPIKLYGKKVKELIANLHSKNKSFFPETLSTISTIDKT